MTRDWGNKQHKVINVDKQMLANSELFYQENILTYYDGLEGVVEVLIVLSVGPDCTLDLAENRKVILYFKINVLGQNLLLKFTGPGSSKQFDDSVRLVASSSRLTVSLSEFKLSYSSDSVLNFFVFLRGLCPVPRLILPLVDLCFFDINIVSLDS